ncbi:MAG: hypothetical protein UR14_C0003G0001, partial [candidate division TM6 bacterium GW2011_GWE2_31_21]
MKNMSKIVKFALLGSVLIASTMNALPFKLENGETFDINNTLIQKSQMLKSMIEVSDAQEDAITLPNITLQQMNLLMPCWVIANPRHTETELATKIKNYPLEQQRQLLLAVDFLNIPQIRDETIKQISNSTELIERFKQNPESFIESEEFNTATNFLPHDLLKQLTKNSN